MDNNLSSVKKMHETQEREKIKKLQKKIDTTKYNIEVSKEIIADTPSDAQQEELIQRNMKRQHGISGIEKKIRNIKQELE
ncbi:putative small, acid-soluble spore protein tlp [uncultured Eubacteriales bacterium]|uniref:Putative small, acid-soluble spore protein tlp n=1 Tax=uncultured Eubacteriales bacterium TaxID=172733 RepID=A0A212KC33_9FIRM|nr:putative small, acid-soluble spore protein tlp [uncultured Eubacteriales bacterium]